MKLGKFLTVLYLAEQGSSFVVRDSESKEVKKVTPAVECVQKVGSLCIQQKNTGYKEEATSEDVSQTYDSEDVAINDNIDLELNPVLSYAMTKDKDFINLAVMGDESINARDSNNPLLGYLAAQKAATDPSLAYALTKDPTLPLANEILADPTLAIHYGMSNPGTVTPQNVILSKILPNASPVSTLALTGSPVLALAEAQGSKIPYAMALTGRDPNKALGFVAAELGDPLLVNALTGDRQAMYAASTNDPTLSYTAQQMNDPLKAYALTKDPILAIQKPKPEAEKAPVNPLLSLIAAKKGDPNLAFALTGDATTAYASTLANPAKAALASAIAPESPILTHVLTKDPVMTLGALKEKDPNNPWLAYAAAQTGDAAIASALTGNPAVAYASQTTKPGLAGLAAAAEKPGLAYIATKDPMMLAMTAKNPVIKNMMAAKTGNPALAYAATGDIGSIYAAQHSKPVLASIAQTQDNPAMTYILTKDPKLALLSTMDTAPAEAPSASSAPAAPSAPVAPLFTEPLLTGPIEGETIYATTMDNPVKGLLASQVEDPATKYLLTKDPLFSFMGTGAIPDSSVNYLAASTGNPLQALALTGNPAVAMAANHANPLLAAAATQTNPATAYLLTKDPVVAAMTAMQPGNNQPAAPVEVDPLKTIVASKVTTDPLMTSVLTGDQNLLLANQWGNSNLALANSLANGAPAPSTNPIFDAVVATKVQNPTVSYALTGNPLLASAVANGKGSDISNLAIAQSLNNPFLSYALTKDPKMMYLSQTANPLLGYTALQTSPALAAIAMQDPTLLLLNKLSP